MDGVDRKAKYSRTRLPGIGDHGRRFDPRQRPPSGDRVAGRARGPEQYPAAQPSTMLTVDFHKLVSRADLDYAEPVKRSEEGQPVGNGRMGSLVWTAPSALRFQINRVDVYAENRDSHSFPDVTATTAAAAVTSISISAISETMSLAPPAFVSAFQSMTAWSLSKETEFRRGSLPAATTM